MKISGILIALIASIWLIVIFPWLLLIMAIGWGISLIAIAISSKNSSKNETNVQATDELLNLDEDEEEVD